jgi:hypothetical protein
MIPSDGPLDRESLPAPPPGPCLGPSFTLLFFVFLSTYPGARAPSCTHSSYPVAAQMKPAVPPPSPPCRGTPFAAAWVPPLAWLARGGCCILSHRLFVTHREIPARCAAPLYCDPSCDRPPPFPSLLPLLFLNQTYLMHPLAIRMPLPFNRRLSIPSGAHDCRSWQRLPGSACLRCCARPFQAFISSSTVFPPIAIHEQSHLRTMHAPTLPQPTRQPLLPASRLDSMPHPRLALPGISGPCASASNAR